MQSSLAQATIFTSKEAMRSQAVTPASGAKRTALAARTVAMATQAGTKTVRGTQRIGTQTVGGTRKITSIEVFTKDKTFRTKTVAKPSPKILSRVQDLRLLSKLEQAGLLSLLEKNGLTLSAIEKSGLLSTAEKFGLISAAADRNTVSTLYTLATGLLAAGPLLVYLTPDDSGALLALQAVGALTCIVGGSAAWGGASLLATLQK
jgi:hypothetical protein